MSSYRDSYFQYQHYIDSYHSLYIEWNDDKFPLIEEEYGYKSNNPNGHTTNIDSSLSTNNLDPDLSGTANAANGGINNNLGYWDQFHDEEDWALFRSFHLDCNGIVTFNILNKETNSQDQTSHGTNIRFDDIDEKVIIIPRGTHPENSVTCNGAHKSDNGFSQQQYYNNDEPDLGDVANSHSHSHSQSNQNTNPETNTADPQNSNLHDPNEIKIRNDPLPETISGIIFNQQKAAFNIARQKTNAWQDWVL